MMPSHDPLPRSCTFPKSQYRSRNGIGLVVASCAAIGFGAIVLVGASPNENLVAQGQELFRYDTFGDEQKWTDELAMHEVIQTAVDPVTAMSVGLKVELMRFRRNSNRTRQQSGRSTSPATTVALLKLNAIVGVMGQVETINGSDQLTRWRHLRCAIRPLTTLHKTSAIDSMAGPTWTSTRDHLFLNVPQPPNICANSWGAGKYDPFQHRRPEHTARPAARVWRRMSRETFTAEGPISLEQLRGRHPDGRPGQFVDRELGIRVVQHPDWSRNSNRFAYQFGLETPPRLRIV
jgi:hypothetical protein